MSDLSARLDEACHILGIEPEKTEDNRYGANLGPSCSFPRRRARVDPDAPWFILRTEPRREKTVAAHLTASDVRWFWPTELRREKAGRNAQWRAVSLFPGIVFAKVARGWFGRVLATPGVLGFMLTTAGEYATLDDTVIDALRFHEIAGLDTREMPTGKKGRVIAFKPRQTVRFAQGPFGGLHAKIASIDPRGRISLLLDLFGRATKIEVAADEIAAA